MDVPTQAQAEETRVNLNMPLFHELVSCGANVYSWTLDATGTLLFSNCPDEDVLYECFDYIGCKEKLLKGAEQDRNPPHPLLLGAENDLIWGAAYEMGPEGLERCHVLGPVFISEQHKRVSVSIFTNQSGSWDLARWNLKLGGAMRAVPVLPFRLFVNHVLMLHYYVNREKLDVSSLRDLSEPDEALAGGQPHHDRVRVWRAEQALLGAVRSGDLDYQNALNTSTLMSAGVPVSGRDKLRQAKTSIIVFISLVVRAAMEGGLSPEVAYPLGDRYIQQSENSTSIAELSALSNKMYDDFVHRVHDCKARADVSEPVRICRDYIETHLDEQVTAAKLAEVAGYSSYYLTRNFKSELGMGFNEYARRAKVERAKTLLVSTNKSVQDIARDLHFSSRSYFCKAFQEVTSETPGEYRKRVRAPME